MTTTSAANTTSAVKRTARAAACALGFAGAALSAAPASAQDPGALAARGRPGQVREMIAPPTTVVATVHYQAELTLTCNNNNCVGDFPRPGAKRRLTVTRITCLLSGHTGTTFSNGQIDMQTADGSHLLYQFLPVDYSSSDGMHTLNRAVDVQVAANYHIFVGLGLTNSGIASGATCTATGTLDTLQ